MSTKSQKRRSLYNNLLKAGREAELQRLIEEELNNGNGDAVVLYAQAKIEEKQENYVKAIELYGKVIQHDPSFFNAAYSKASCECKIDLPNEAIETYNFALSQDDNTPKIISRSRRSSTLPNFDIEKATVQRQNSVKCPRGKFLTQTPSNILEVSSDSSEEFESPKKVHNDEATAARHIGETT